MSAVPTDQIAVPTDQIAVPTSALPRVGDFEGKPLVHAFNPVPEDTAYGTSLFGLIEADFWPYGAVRTESGRWYPYFRSISGMVTTGLVVMSSDGGPLGYDERSASSFAGMMQRSATGGADVYEPEGPGAPFLLRASPTDGIEWVESDILRLSGPIAGPGLQMLNGWREPDGRLAHMLHTHLGFEVHGTVFGERASGYLGLAKGYVPYGVPWQTPHRFGPSPGLCALWLAFLNVYEDGSCERGMLADGGAANRFRFANIVRRDGLEVSTDQLTTDYSVGRHGFLEAIDFHVGNGSEWAFTSEPGDHLDFTGMLPTFALEPPVGYHVSLGTMRRVGDTRIPVIQIAWVEGFPQAWDPAITQAVAQRA